jgi:hypothetical protein
MAVAEPRIVPRPCNRDQSKSAEPWEARINLACGGSRRRAPDQSSYRLDSEKSAVGSMLDDKARTRPRSMLRRAASHRYAITIAVVVAQVNVCDCGHV